MISRKPRQLWLFFALLLGLASPAVSQSPPWTGPVYGPGSHQYLPPRPAAGLPAASPALLAQIAALQKQVTQIQAASAPAVFGQPITNRTGRLAVCHFQLSCRAWENGSQAGYLGAITKARDMGFDGFSIDDGANTPEYLQNRTRIYAACNQFNATNKGAVNRWGVGDFKLFTTLDMATFPYTQADIVAVLAPVLKDPANLLWQGKPVYSTYAGGRFGTQENLKSFWQGVSGALKTSGVTPFFIPGFETTDASCNYIPNNQASSAAMTAFLKAFSDGWWQYDGGSPLTQDSSLPGDEVRNLAVTNAGMIAMTSQMVEYWGARHSTGTDGTSHFYHEYYGGEGLSATWKSILARPPPIVQFLTFNDYDEGSNIDDHDVGPGSSWPYLFHSAVNGYYVSKAGKVVEWQLGLHEYKTGLPPKIVNDTVNVFYRTQTKDCILGTKPDGSLIDPLGPIAYASSENGGGPAPASLEDVACITCIFSRSQTLAWKIGTKTWTRPMPAGITRLRVPFVAGQPSLTISALDGSSFSVPGLIPIADHADYSDANIFSASAHN